MIGFLSPSRDPGQPAILSLAARQALVGAVLGCLAVGNVAGKEPRAALPAAVCVTTGEVRAEADGRYVVESAASRAVVRDGDDDYVGIQFEYLGPSQQKSALASGAVKAQLGIKLQAQDSCNVVYVMWPVDGTTLEVSTKVNAGKSTHAECGVKGYEALKPRFTKAVAPLVVGQQRRLEASIDARMLSVKVDGDLVWRGDAGKRTEDLFGYPGIRTDNVRMRFAWLVEPDTDVAPRGKPKLTCHPLR